MRRRFILALAAIAGLAATLQACPDLSGTYRSAAKGKVDATDFTIRQDGCERVEILSRNLSSESVDRLVVKPDGVSHLIKKPHKAAQDAHVTAQFKGDILVCKFNWEGGMVTFQTFQLDAQDRLHMTNRMTLPQEYSGPEIIAKRQN